MAYKVQRINPLDLQPRKAVGIALPFSGRAVFNSTYTSKDAVRNNIINYFLTGKNERVFNKYWQWYRNVNYRIYKIYNKKIKY